MSQDKPPESDRIEQAIHKLEDAEAREQAAEAELAKDQKDVAEAIEELKAAEKDRDRPKGPPSHEHQPAPRAPSRPPHHRPVG